MTGTLGRAIRLAVGLGELSLLIPLFTDLRASMWGGELPIRHVVFYMLLGAAPVAVTLPESALGSAYTFTMDLASGLRWRVQLTTDGLIRLGPRGGQALQPGPVPAVRREDTLLGSVGVATAQNEEWTRLWHGDSPEDDKGFSVLWADGSLFVAGFTNINTQGRTDDDGLLPPMPLPLIDLVRRRAASA